MILIESISEAIAQLLSPKVAAKLCEHLQKVNSIKKDEVPYRLDKHLLALKTTFGSSISQVIWKTIAKRFYSRLGLGFSNRPQETLVDYVENAKLAQHN